MSKSEHWFPLYVADYLADTAHLSTAEHGAYLLLLMHQWRQGCVPNDEKQLSKITRQTVPEWRRMAETVLAFFQERDGDLVQGRLERVRAEQAEKRQRLSEAGRRAGIASAAQRSFSARSTAVQRSGNDLPTIDPTIDQRLTNQPEPEPEDRVIPFGHNSRARRPRAAHPEPKGFAEFWGLYPAKVGKAAARKAWPRAVQQAGGDPNDIVFALKARLHLFPDDDRFIPNPATWLNQGRWEDDPDTLFARNQRSA